MANKRGRQTVWDMVLSMAAIGVVVAVIYLFVPHDENHDPVRTVSYTVELDQARRDAPFKVAGPVGLAKGWRASSVTYNSADPKNVQWHLGFVDPQNQYAAVEQSNAPAATFIAQKSHDARRNGTRVIAGERWLQYDGTKYDALVREESGVTTIVTGTSSPARLTQLAAALEERGGK